MAIKRGASARWTGDLKSGKGTLTTDSKVLSSTAYGFKSRFDAGSETNPEELVGAAHAGCFTMAVTAALTQAGYTAESLDTKVTVVLTQADGGWSIPRIDLDLTARIPGIDDAKFQKIAADAKANCPISKLFKAEMALTARLA